VALFCARRDPVYEDYSQFLTRAFQGSHATRLQQRQKQSHLKNYGPAPTPYRVGTTSHVALPRTHHEEAAKPPTAEEEPDEQPTKQKRNSYPICRRSCCPSQGRHEQVTKDKPSIQEERSQPATAPATNKKAPEGARTTEFLHTQRLTSP
jgi:hypothetical protein